MCEYENWAQPPFTFSSVSLALSLSLSVSQLSAELSLLQTKPLLWPYNTTTQETLFLSTFIKQCSCICQIS